MKTSYIALLLAAVLILAAVYFTTSKGGDVPETAAPAAAETDGKPESAAPAAPEAVPEAAEVAADPECSQYSLVNGAWVCTRTASTGN
ncbi:MAG: hypothetical protein KBF85_11345 [Tabrizicola sp.]|jgi:hypothetical protein|nr:hypothetical protein [Tabrizicola sp.]